MGDDKRDEEKLGRLIAAAAYLLEGAYKCDSCDRPTTVFTVVAVGPLQGEGDVWVDDDDFSCILRRLDQLPEPMARAAATASAGRFRLDYSSTAGERYFMNHCQHCGGKLGDWFVHAPGEAFFPTHSGAIALVKGQRLEGPFVFDDPDVSSSGWTDEWLESNSVAVPRRREPPAKRTRARRAPK